MSRTRPGVDLSPIGPGGRLTFTVPEVAAILGVGRDAAYQAAAAGQIPGLVRIGRKITFARAVVLEWLGQDASSGLKRESR